MCDEHRVENAIIEPTILLCKRCHHRRHRQGRGLPAPNYYYDMAGAAIARYARQVYLHEQRLTIDKCP